MSTELHHALNQQVGNFSVLYEKLHHYHWFVKGVQFFTLHEKFQADYEEITELVDELAERLIQIGGTPVSSLKEYLGVTSLTENQKETSDARSMVASLLKDYKQLVEEYKGAIEVADDADDNVTEDLLIGILASLEKKVWLYESFLTK